MLNDNSALLEAALGLAAQGLQILPLYHPLNKDRCSCGRSDCMQIGKHSRVDLGEATTDETKIRQWWTEHPHSNVGLRIGTKLVVLNVDGEAGETALASLERRYGSLPQTLESRTGRGRHLYFFQPNHGTVLKPGAVPLGTGLCLLADRQYVVAPPSRHSTGMSYEFEGEPRPAELPSWLADLVKEPSQTTSHSQSEMTQQVNAVPATAVASASSIPQLGDILDDIEQLIHRYISLPSPELAMVIACWIANTYTYELFRYCGYISIRSSTPGCGKSRLLEVVAMLSNGNPAVTVGPTPATIYRSSDRVHCFDEMDQLRGMDKDSAANMMAILNQGFKRGAMVKRVDRGQSGSFAVQPFSAYSPKIFAGLERLEDTLASRCFLILMAPSLHRSPRIPRNLDEQAERIRTALTKWAEQHRAAIEAEIASLPDGATPELEDYDDRFQDIAEPLLVLVRLADAERPEGPLVMPRLLAGLKSAAHKRAPSTVERQHIALLEILSNRLPAGEDDTFVPTNTLLTDCKEKEILNSIQTSRALAARMDELGQTPISNGQYRGYRIRREWLEEWRGRYRLS